MNLHRSLALAGFLVFAAVPSLLFGSPMLTVPPGLSAGQQYRIIFVTSTTTTATSPTISDYDTFVSDAANAAGSLLAPLGATWQAVASTSTVSAIDHIGSDDVPIFLLDGTEVADSAADLWSPTGLLAADGIDLTELGTDAALFTWTGTGPDGTALDPLGSLAAVVEGCTITPDHTLWIDAGSPAPAAELPLYGISSLLTVVPEPGYFGILAAALLVFGARRQLSGRGH